MKKISILFFAIILFTNGYAQPQEAARLHETAKNFMKASDFSNAVLVLNKCIELDPGNITYTKDLALAYFFGKDNTKALDVIKPALNHQDADDQCYQVAGYIYKELVQLKECEKMYRKGIKKFPASGALYNDLGELLWAQQNYAAIRQWEKGIEEDPSYPKNYYNACRYYYLTTDKVWSILYGEVFINMEPQSTQAPEIKNILLESYKKLFGDGHKTANPKLRQGFIKMFLQVMDKQSALASQGINAESLTMIRTRFILEWGSSYANKFPFKLFEYQQQLLREGLFNAYNQWIFGSTQNLSAYQQWIKTNSEEYNTFIRFQKSRVFKMNLGEYYH